MTDKSLKELMEDESERLDAEDLQKAVEAQAAQDVEAHPEEPYQPTMEELEEYLVAEGQWLEGQMAAETAHKQCPMCSVLTEVFQALAGGMEEALEQLDKLKESGLEERFVIEMLLRDKAWYECAKGIAMQMFEQGHRPRNVINAHPELRGLAFQKRARHRQHGAGKKRKKSRKTKRH